MFGQHKMCLFASFMLGAAAGYMYYEYVMTPSGRRKRKKCSPVVVVPRDVLKKARRLKKDLQNTLDDIM